MGCFTAHKFPGSIGDIRFWRPGLIIESRGTIGGLIVPVGEVLCEIFQSFAAIYAAYRANILKKALASLLCHTWEITPGCIASPGQWYPPAPLSFVRKVGASLPSERRQVHPAGSGGNGGIVALRKFPAGNDQLLLVAHA